MGLIIVRKGLLLDDHVPIMLVIGDVQLKFGFNRPGVGFNWSACRGTIRCVLFGTPK